MSRRIGVSWSGPPNAAGDRLSDLNPLEHVVDGVREMLRGEFGAWPSLGAIGITLALVVVGVAVGTRVFQRESA